MKFVPNIPYKKGLLPEYSSSFINLPWNDKTAVENFFAENSHNIAAVICEPLCCHAGPIPPVDDFLQFLRDITSVSYTHLDVYKRQIEDGKVLVGREDDTRQTRALHGLTPCLLYTSREKNYMRILSLAPEVL